MCEEYLCDGGKSPDEPTREREVAREMTSLDQMIVGIEDRVGELVTRLTPVCHQRLTPDPRQVPGTSPYVPLALDLENAAGRLQTIRDRLSGVLEGLEI